MQKILKLSLCLALLGQASSALSMHKFNSLTPEQKQALTDLADKGEAAFNASPLAKKHKTSYAEWQAYVANAPQSAAPAPTVQKPQPNVPTGQTGPNKPAGQPSVQNQPTATNKPTGGQSVTTTPIVPAGQLDQATQQALNDAKTAAVAVKQAARQLDTDNKKKNINTNIEKTVIDQLVASLTS